MQSVMRTSLHMKRRGDSWHQSSKRSHLYVHGTAISSFFTSNSALNPMFLAISTLMLKVSIAQRQLACSALSIKRLEARISPPPNVVNSKKKKKKFGYGQLIRREFILLGFNLNFFSLWLFPPKKKYLSPRILLRFPMFEL